MSNAPQQFLINPGSPPAAPYTTQQNPNYGLYNSDGQFIFNPALNISNTYVSPASLPSFPIQAGGNASQITSNQENKSVFTALNLQQEQVRAGMRTLNGPIFKSYREQMAYIQAQYTQPLPKPNPAATLPPTVTTPTTISVSTPTQTIYSTSTLFDMYTNGNYVFGSQPANPQARPSLILPPPSQPPQC
jgi:hypothetical protein